MGWIKEVTEIKKGVSEGSRMVNNQERVGMALISVEGVHFDESQLNNNNNLNMSPRQKLVDLLKNYNVGLCGIQN